MRRKDRQMSAEWALEVFDRAPFITVGMTQPDGTPYALPLSLVRAADNVFYFHCAAEGEKIDCLRSQPCVSFSAVSYCSPEYIADRHNFTMYYDSAMAFGRAEFVTDNAEKMLALRLLCRRFLPEYMEHFVPAAERSVSHTTVVKITLTAPPTGKNHSALR